MKRSGGSAEAAKTRPPRHVAGLARGAMTAKDRPPPSRAGGRTSRGSPAHAPQRPKNVTPRLSPLTQRAESVGPARGPPRRRRSLSVPPPRVGRKNLPGRRRPPVSRRTVSRRSNCRTPPRQRRRCVGRSRIGRTLPSSSGCVQAASPSGTVRGCWPRSARPPWWSSPSASPPRWVCTAPRTPHLPRSPWDRRRPRRAPRRRTRSDP